MTGNDRMSALERSLLQMLGKEASDKTFSLLLYKLINNALDVKLMSRRGIVDAIFGELLSIVGQELLKRRDWVYRPGEVVFPDSAPTTGDK